MVRDVRGNKKRAHYRNVKCIKAKNRLCFKKCNVLKDISNSEHIKIYLQNKNKGVITQHHFHRHHIYSYLIQSALSFHFTYIHRPLLCRRKWQKAAQACNRSIAISSTYNLQLNLQCLQMTLNVDDTQKQYRDMVLGKKNPQPKTKPEGQKRSIFSVVTIHLLWMGMDVCQWYLKSEIAVFQRVSILNSRNIFICKQKKTQLLIWNKLSLVCLQLFQRNFSFRKQVTAQS